MANYQQPHQQARSGPQGVQRAERATGIAKAKVSSPGAEILPRVRKLLNAGRVKNALEVVNAKSSADPMLKNARGVCLLRLQQADAAVRVFRELCLDSSGVILRSDVPVFVKTNFATALLMSGTVSGCVDVLSEIGDERDERVQQLRGAIRAWVSGLPFWRRVLWRLGVEPKKRVTLAFDPGELERGAV